jgi:hypothetical protein
METSSIDWTQQSRFIFNFLLEDGDRIQFPKRCVLKEKQGDVLYKDKMMDNIQKHNIWTIKLSRRYVLLEIKLNFKLLYNHKREIRGGRGILDEIVQTKT